ncbi:MAG: hypothetical protein ACI90V_005156 [Bacillariaceae sp.]|jgi:hypothetical protein
MFDLYLSMKKFLRKKSQMYCCSFNVVMTLCIRKMHVSLIMMIKKGLYVQFFFFLKNMKKLHSSEPISNFSLGRRCVLL